MEVKNRREHWERAYQGKAPDLVGWYQERPEMSLRMIEADLPPYAPVFDAGGGASTLAGYLLEMGFLDITVLDIAAPAIEAAKESLGDRAADVNWITSDITTWQPARHYRLWHDRAVFHFLTKESDRRAYMDVLMKALAPYGHVIISTFAVDGPELCSGLPVRRYDEASLAAELGPAFRLVESVNERHFTPGMSEQSFLYCHFQKK